MFETMSGAELMALALALAVVGCCSGFLAGLLGVGGGIVIVPALFYVFDFLDIDEAIRAHLAVGTSLATIIPTSIISLRAHRKREAVDDALLKSWGPMIALGVIIGVVIAAFVDGKALTGVFGIVALIVALYMLFSLEGTRLKDGLPGQPWRSLIATFIGGVSTLMGIGGGTLSVPILSLFNFPLRRAVGTASAIGLIIAVPGTLGFVINGWGAEDLPPFSLGYVSLVGFAAIVPTSMLFAPYGARAAHSMQVGWLRKSFALFLGLTGVKMVWTLFS
ncbi:sulfite exporter TauE/SafE family protein [Dongia sp.]|uniref:sulfite exporter TauE/SafE family protein n=1 Tax=Dongia sp. TaxID=1977262 RepID=UPI0035B406A7